VATIAAWIIERGTGRLVDENLVLGNGCDDVRVDEFADQLQLSHQLGSTDNSYLFSPLYQRGLLVADSLEAIRNPR